MEASPTIRRMMLTLMLEHNVHVEFDDDGSTLVVDNTTLPLSVLPLVYMIATATGDVAEIEFNMDYNNTSERRKRLLAHHEAMLNEAIDREQAT